MSKPLLALAVCLPLVACVPMNPSDPRATVTDPVEPRPYVALQHAEWSRNATIYQVNVR